MMSLAPGPVAFTVFRVLKVNAIGAGAVDYLLRGSGCDRHKEEQLRAEREQARDGGREGGQAGLEGLGRDALHEHDRDRGGDRELGERGSGAGYLQSGVEHGEPAGQWYGSGISALRFGFYAGETVTDRDARAILGELRRPESTSEDPEYIGSKPRNYKTGAQRLAALREKEPDASPERLRQLEARAAQDGRRPVAYYDFTFSPVKSVSVFYAALVTAGDTERAGAVREAHDEAVRIALDYAEQHVAYTRAGRHASDGNGRSVGEFVKGEGLVAGLFAHHTNRESEPQLHTHAAVLNRLAAVLRDGTEHVGALDGRAIRPIKEAIATAYERAVEQLVSERTGVRFETRPDGKAREIVGIDPELMRDASTRRNQVVDRTEALVEGYRARWGRDPDAEARRHIADIAAYETRKPKTGRAGPGAVADWGAPRRDRLEAMLDQIDAAGLSSRGDRAGRDSTGPDGGSRPGGGADSPGRDRDRDTGQRGLWARLSEVSDRLRGLSRDQEVSQPGQAGRGVGLSDPEYRGRVLAAGLDDVQQRYASWTLGNLAAAIDRQLGEAGHLGITAAERPALLEELAREAVAGQAVVQLVGHEPVAVPAELRRVGEGQDGQPMFRPHLDQRYATAAHLAAEHRVLARVRGDGGLTIQPSQRGVVEQQLVRQGLSADQRSAVLGILSSGGRGDVLVGPAGTGKSRTVSALAQTWAAGVGARHGGGRVFGVATSEIATQQLSGDGLTALNTTRFINAFTPDADGRIRDHLRPGDMVVVDEAGMSSTAELDTITALVDGAGAKIVFTGDPAQLGSVGAGGLFAHLAAHLPGAEAPADPRDHDRDGASTGGDRAGQAGPEGGPAELDRDGAGQDGPGQHEVAQAGTRVWSLSSVHRFTESWEREASLLLRDGDQSAVAEYADRGRLVTGTSDEMTAKASRGYLGDLLAGKDTLLVVATNEAASEMSRDVQRDLIDVGRVDPRSWLGKLADGNDLRVGDRVQARHNDWSITVEPGRDADGRSVAPKVVNRAMYTVLGRGAGDTVRARDEHTGAVAHLPTDYLKQHTVLGYALTIYGAQGVTVDTTHGVLDRDATRELAYVLATRGRENNLMYLVTDHVPDSHDPQALQELAAERFSAILEDRGSEPAAVDIAETPEQISGLAALGARFEVVSREASREHTNQVLAAALPAVHAERLAAEGPAYERLIRTVHAAELDGHDPAALLGEVITARELDSAESVGDTLRWRIDGQLPGRIPDHRPEPGQGQDPSRASDWSDRVPAGQGPVHDYLTEVAELADQAQARAGARAATEQAGWAVAVLGPVPDRDTDPDRYALWEQAAGRVAAKHQVVGHDEPETTIGTAPSRERELHHQIWRGAADAAAELAPDRGGQSSSGRAWSALTDAELYEATDRWARELDAAPRWVADQLAGAHRLAREARGEAAIERAQLAGLDPHSDQGRALAEAAARHERFAETYTADAAVLETAHQQRQTWWSEHAHLESDAAAATDELVKRGLANPRDPQIAFDLDEAPRGTVDHSTRAGRHRDLDPAQHQPDLEQHRRETERDTGGAADPKSGRGGQDERGDGEHARDGNTSARALGLVAEAEQATQAREAAESAWRRDQASRREQRLTSVDPEGRLDPSAREAALRAHDYDQAMTRLRDEHGQRLDPDHRLSGDELAARRAAEIAEQVTDRQTTRGTSDQDLADRLDPDHTLTDPQRDALVWQHHQQQHRSQQRDHTDRQTGSGDGDREQTPEPERSTDTSRTRVGDPDRDVRESLAEAHQRLQDTQRTGQRENAGAQARHDANEREQTRQAAQQAREEHEAQRAERDDRDRAATERVHGRPDRSSVGRDDRGSGERGRDRGNDGRSGAPERDRDPSRDRGDAAGRGLGNGLDEGYARRNRGADEHAEQQRQQDRQRGDD